MNIAIVGGDKRIVELTKALQKDNKIYVYGLEKCEELSQFEHSKSIKETVENSDKIITAIPISKDGINLSTPFSSETVELKDFFEKTKGKNIISGSITPKIKEIIQECGCNEKNVIDVLEDEELAILNAIPTAEGAIQLAMENSNITLHGSNCLVLGFGRIGKILSKMLLGLGANVYCEARKKTDLAQIKSYGYCPIHLKELGEHLNKFDFIFNTIPYIILDRENLKKVKKSCLLMELASVPGGIDEKETRRTELEIYYGKRFTTEKLLLKQ